MKRWTRAAALALAAAVLFCACTFDGPKIGAAAPTEPAAGQAKTAVLDPAHPTNLVVWHYYNGTQQAKFTEFVAAFNATVGAQEGIHVEEHSLGSIEDLENSVLAAARKEVGASALPNIFASYADAAYTVDQMGLIADLAPYFTEDELDEYVDDYLEEGRLSGPDSLKIFPMAKNTEVLMLNQTDWNTFAAATGAQAAQLATIEGVTATAKAYYEWTDGLTPDVPNDGKAFFGRDAFANYMLVGARQLGTEIFAVKDGTCTLHFDKATVRRLWDNYYVPMVAGWYAENGRFRSDDVKLGDMIACVCSTSGASYFPSSVLISDTESYPIRTQALPAPKFAGGEPYAVQQGAGMAVTKGTDAQVYASVVFLKWFTEPSRNASFAALSGYLPVTKTAAESRFFNQTMHTDQVDANMRAVLDTAITTTQDNHLYTVGAFSHGTDARAVLNNSLPQKAAADRAAFLALLAQGAEYDDALAQFDTDENFDAWYEDTRAQLQALIAP